MGTAKNNYRSVPGVRFLYVKTHTSNDTGAMSKITINQVALTRRVRMSR